MKKLKLLLSIPCVLFLQTTFAQAQDHVMLSSEHPAAGQKINITYDASGTELADKGAPEAVVYFLDNKQYPAADVDLTADGKKWKGSFTIPDAAKAFFVKISSDGTIDDNNDKGYVFLVYKGDKPVEGAYASKAYLLYSGMGNYFAKIKSDMDEAGNLYAKEFEMYPQSEKEFQSNYLIYLSAQKDDKSKELLSQKIDALAASGDEKDMMLASSIYARTRKAKMADSLNKVIKTKFPEGVMARNEMGMAFNQEKDLTKKETLYKEYVAKYPETEDNKALLENYKLQLASAYLQAGDIAGYQKWADQIKDKSNLAGALNNVAWAWAEKGEKLDEAAKLSKQSLEVLDAKLNDLGTPMYMSPKQAKESNRSSYDMYADTYAYILYQQGKYKEALTYQQPVYEHAKTPDAEISEHYALILGANGQYAKAQDVIEKTIKAGKSSDVLKKELAKDYIKVKGSDKGYDTYLAGLENAAKNKQMEELAKQMINKPAPSFALKDFDGKTVSLASLKGKVVIVDFWATWCGPCKASFPGMQLAVNKYKDDPNVKFLFVDTWENGDNYMPGVKKFIADNKYTFHVLMDEKGDDGRQSKVVTQFGVTGIPTKFIIDKNGNIRFKMVGFSGTPEGIREEVSSMIEMASNPDAIADSPKVTMN
ncbi:redoxin domain-containing protein [Mucilaginibacter segetis]|uniref:Redoxin domain-containing protein n=1 Tax=Mucilaginibacter segetis TaxID=2793071 RepID=A0A934UM60_9SPHI|nr:redoxin domain-containing protein [Mucilaginibacter segetis]MBK0379074.1 redoxin domain-containing protein [Mucilaginibacter segetis]